ncbi:hypothetical protein M408DRAFT_178249 [Serendipita vermifera MAFF 305830]|uniref:DUF7587 domain-containing protein n=1 Tax=Serendipita vermifera MAFF 305830 TaxID=933852 RepID=A0A0C3B3S7_SERVB|nr:hypothetical protein M408DRAFT_178249 [Serendipita vermifera MAFF 305830]
MQIPQVDPRNFPLTLYRVTHSEASTTYSPRRGFHAANKRRPETLGEFCTTVEKHLRWRCKDASPFISTFKDRTHAYNWARRWSRNHNRNPCYVVEIEVMPGDDVTVYRVTELVEELEVDPGPLQPEQYASEYLFLHHIPPEAIIGEPEEVRYEGYPMPRNTRYTIRYLDF